MDWLVESVRATGRLGVGGVYVPQDPGAATSCTRPPDAKIKPKVKIKVKIKIKGPVIPNGPRRLRCRRDRAPASGGRRRSGC